MAQPDPTAADLAAAEAVLDASEAWPVEDVLRVLADWNKMRDAIAAALGNARREGREAGLAQAAERVRAQARRFDPITWDRLADEIAALPPPGEGG